MLEIVHAIKDFIAWYINRILAFLLPCPFCKGKAGFQEYSEEIGYVGLECPQCGGTGNIVFTKE